MRCYLKATGNKKNKKEYGCFSFILVDDKDNIVDYYFSKNDNTTYILENFKGILYIMEKYGKNKNITLYCDSGVAVQTFTNWIFKWQYFNWKKINGEPPQHLELLQKYYNLILKGHRIYIKRLKGYRNRKLFSKINEYEEVNK